MFLFVFCFSCVCTNTFAGYFTASNTTQTSAGVVQLDNESQISTFGIATAQRANDGNTNGLFSNGSVSSTKREVQAWWQAELVAPANISKIEIFNRTNCCLNRLSNFYVLVSSAPFGSSSLSSLLADPNVESYHHQGIAGSSISIPVNTFGQYVRIQLNKTDYLSLAEVVVYKQNDALDKVEAEACLLYTSPSPRDS